MDSVPLPGDITLPSSAEFLALGRVENWDWGITDHIQLTVG